MYSGQQVIKLPNSGTSCPIIGTGTWAPDVGEERTTIARGWITTALKAWLGFRHIDTAYGYGTEKAVGEAIIQAGLKREDVFVVSKLPPHHHHCVAASLQETLDNLGFKFGGSTWSVSLSGSFFIRLSLPQYLMHWPFPVLEDENGKLTCPETPTISETWAQMEDVLRQSKCEAIGVSNFSIKNLEVLLKNARTKPAMNQVEMHPYLAQNDLLEFCRKHGIVVVAYTPSGGKDKIRKDPVIVSLAEKYNVVPNQVILAWHLARGVVVIPRTANEKHQKENLNLPTLEAEDVKKIDALDRGERLCNPVDANGLVWGIPGERLGW
ncbi:Aldo-keto reductase [Mycena chlorophos]|uniref:Aldo-keto reductase n=1 Tax=Mycena chlorophos TaxID=658473 RepID=A0A8H6TQS1_MYCCL|nr:Aldo-keto reductase [Mycena chlorophos]